MGLDPATLEMLQKTAVQAAGASLLAVPGDGRKVCIVCNGMLTPIEVVPPVRKHTIEDLEDFASAIEKWGATGTVWVSESKVVLVIDDEDRRDLVTMPLLHSAVFGTLRKLEEQRCMNQKQLVRLLRHDLAEYLSRLDLPALFGKLNFKRRNDGSADITRQRESLGRSVEAEVTATEDLPENIVVTCPVYRTSGVAYKSQVTLTVDIDPTAETFLLTPLPDALNKAVDQAQSYIWEELLRLVPGVEGRLFAGTP